MLPGGTPRDKTPIREPQLKAGQSSCVTTAEGLATTKPYSLVAVLYDIGFMTAMTQVGGPSTSNDFNYNNNSAGWGLFLWDAITPNSGQNTWNWNVSGCTTGY